MQPPLLLAHVVARLDDLDGGREGARPADPQLLERLDQRGLGVARRWLGEMLLGLELLQVEHLADGQQRQFFLFVVVAVPLPDAIEAIEHQHGSVGSEEIVPGADIDPRLGEPCGRHLAGRKALPDQSIQSQLIRRQGLPHRVRRARDVGRPDRLVGILYRPLRLEFDLVAAGIGGTVLLGDEAASGRRCFV